MDEPTDSQIVCDISQHSAQSVAASLLAFPNTVMVHPADPSWYQWKAHWQNGNRFIDLNLTLFDDEETWGGSEVEADCLAGDVIKLWTLLQARHSGVWLHAPDCTMHTQESFLTEFVVGETQQRWGGLNREE